jgi:hypothetical protein
MTIEEIQQQCKTLSNDELFQVVNNKQLYNEKIVRVAYQEIRNRRISKQEAREIRKVQARRAKVISGNIHEDVLFWEKVGFFFLCVPRMHYLVIRDYRRQGFVLKVRQGLYYNLFGVIFLISSAVLGQYFHSFLAGGIFWMGSFLLTYLFSQYYFKARIIKHLAARSADPETK